MADHALAAFSERPDRMASGEFEGTRDFFQAKMLGRFMKNPCRMNKIDFASIMARFLHQAAQPR